MSHGHLESLPARGTLSSRPTWIPAGFTLGEGLRPGGGSQEPRCQAHGLPCAPRSGLFRSPASRKACLSGLFMAPTPAFVLRARGAHETLCSGRGAPISASTGNWKLETQGLSPLRLRLTRRQTQHPPDLCSLHLRQAGSGHPTEAPQKSSAAPASCATESSRSQPLLSRWPVIFFLGGEVVFNKANA